MIKKMKKVLILGPEDNRKKIFKSLQKKGVVEIDNYTGSQYETSDVMVDSAFSDKILNMYKYLQKYEDIASEYNVNIDHSSESQEDIFETVNDLEKELSSLKENEQLLKTKIRLVEPWGRFNNEDFNYIEKKSGVHIQFWEASEKIYETLDLSYIDHFYYVREYNQRKYFITFSDKEENIENCIEFKFEDDLEDLHLKLVHNERDQHAVVKKIISYLPQKEKLFKYYLSELNKVNFERASSLSITTLEGRVFAVQGWTTEENIPVISEECKKYNAEIFQIEIEKNDKVPTLLENKKVAALGQGLVEFYDTPSYKDWDPSAWVFLSFTVFFAMIMGDGGYGFTLFLLLLFIRFKMKNLKKSSKRFFGMALSLTFATFIYGSLFSGFYGFSLPIPGIENLQKSLNLSFFDNFVLFRSLKEGSPEKNGILMKVSVLIGLGHISLSLVLKALRDFSKKQFISPFSNFAWIAIMWSFFIVYPMAEGSTEKLVELMFKTSPWNYIFIGSFITVFLTSAGTFKPGKLIGGGLGGLYNGVQFFSDVLSYIRIFALGLSGSLIAITFNDMAGSIFEAIPYLGPVFALLIFVFGHLLNIGLCLMGAVIHGLRLNFLEFYRWSFDGDGRAFKPLKDLLSD